MNKPTIQAAGGSSGGCVISGVPSQYDGGVEYTIKVRIIIVYQEECPLLSMYVSTSNI